MGRPEFTFLEPEAAIGLNIGGQMFETTVNVLTRDPYSILAACCRIDSTMPPEPHTGVFYFDRDWWLFRHILSFLRSNVLPNELETLKELYTEASFYRLESLQRAIEDIPLSEVSNATPSINVTWPGFADNAPNPLRRARSEESKILSKQLYTPTY